MEKKILFVKNIIPPYRISLFNSLQKFVENKRDFKFKVFVCNRSERGRHWKLDEDELSFNYMIDDTGFYKNIFNKYHLRMNPKLFRYVFKNPNDHIIAGSSWNDLNVIILSILKRLKIIPNKLSFWSEANYHTVHKRNSRNYINVLFEVVRNFVLNSGDSKFLIPGEIAKETLFNKWKLKEKGIIFFPNLISKEFDNDIGHYVNNNGVKNILIVARHNESHKGILNFIKSVDFKNDFVIWLAGDGPDTDLYKLYVEESKLESQVIFLGNLKEKDLREYYTKANFFVLPSIYDQSPLTIVEAAYSKLPLFVSERCGNHTELIMNGENGFIFDPSDNEEINKKFNKLLKMSIEDLQKMGDLSYDIVKKRYDEKKIFSDFINEI